MFIYPSMHGRDIIDITSDAERPNANPPSVLAFVEAAGRSAVVADEGAHHGCR